MSGSSIGGVVGAAVGFYVGGPQGAQWGWMIGSAVGGYVDPEQVFGPRLQDASQQTAMVGVYITRGWGTFRTAGNLIWQEPTIVEHKKTERQGKGGPEQVTYTYTRSHAIGICRGPVTGILIVKENGKVVLDQRTDAVILAEYASAGITGSSADAKLAQQRAQNAKFLENTVFYLGTEDQLPDPTIEEHKGVNNAPAYPGLCYMVRENPELVMQGAISQYEFVVVRDGVADENVGSLEPVNFAGFTKPWREDADQVRDPRLPGVEYEYGYIPAAGSYSAAVWGFSSPIAAIDAAIAAGFGGGRTYAGTPTLRGWTNWNEFRGDTWQGVNNIWPWDGAPKDANASIAIGLVYSRYPADEEISGINLSYAVITGPQFAAGKWLHDPTGDQAHVYTGVWVSKPALSAGIDDGFANWHGDDGISGGSDAIRYYADMVVVCRPQQSCGVGVEDTWTPIPDALGFYVDQTGGIHGGMACSLTTGTFKQLAPLKIVSASNPAVVTMAQGPVLRTTDPNYSNSSYWHAQYAAAVSVGTMPPLMSYNASGDGTPGTYPVVVTEACECLPATPVVAPEGVLLATIVSDLCRDEGLSTEEIDVSQLTDIVPGFRIASEGGADAAIAALQSVYLFDVGEWDGKVRFIKRGGTSSFAINDDDLVERDGEPFEVETIQEFELLRSVTVGYSDPAAGYGPNTQKWERRTSLIEARGEASSELPITITADTAATAAKRKGMVAWGEPEKHKFGLPYRLSYITPTDIGSYTDATGEVRQIRVMQAEDDSGVRYMETATNSAEAYNTTATGIAPKPPTVTEGSIRGPTFAVYMNLPRLRTQENVPGITIAACGLNTGWQGCAIFLSVDGGISYQAVADFDQPSTMGRLTADCTSSSEPISVRMNAGSLQSVTDEQITARRNAFAITSSDVSEVGQFKTATAGGSGLYDLTNTYRGVLDTTAVAHESGDPFVMVETTQFVPVDAMWAGKTLYFKAVTFGTSQDSATAVPFVYSPQFVGPAPDPEFFITNTGEVIVTSDGEYILVG